jgi:hypothetical protein
MEDEIPRSRAARVAAETALVRVVHHYGSRPEFVLMGGLMPEYLCAGSGLHHAGTSDVDVQVDLEIACGAVNVKKLEQALRNAEFEPDAERVWRWTADGAGIPAVVKFELLADDEEVRSGEILQFKECDALGAVNLRGTGFAPRDVVTRRLTARVGDLMRAVEINATGLAGFLMAKTAAARERRKAKDWYDIAFVLLHNDAGGPEEAAKAILARFPDELVGGTRTALDDLSANFMDTGSQGSQAYADQMMVDYPDLDRGTLAADAVVAVKTFHRLLTQT